MLFLSELVHSKSSHIGIDIVQHVRVLVATQPFVLPIKSQGHVAAQQLSDQIFILQVPGIVKLAPVLVLHGLDWKVNFWLHDSCGFLISALGLGLVLLFHLLSLNRKRLVNVRVEFKKILVAKANAKKEEYEIVALDFGVFCFRFGVLIVEDGVLKT